MAEPLDPKELVTVEEIAISNMREIAGVVEVPERKGILTRQELYATSTELRQRNPETTRLERQPTGIV